eukprot:CAMPEP_0168496774 /NCGR_PEP_ID=MMETSP0228-20121227/72433_1 /TAXON_ID=133427 /ORGANISM="Protoceratium reticulatum, Strain CCCM 535 (=CCMP 1889)" /LENGTH=376 /DNA_ID=CAMNT_0008513649 /DNA_START=22 /DNA_END=1149 /DNA_ORIENTATION=-
MNVNHRGHHEFFICDRSITSDDGAVECLQRWPLMRVRPEEVHTDCRVNDPREDCQPIDPNYPGRWYHPPGKTMHSIRYRIPQGLQCQACTLQWFWPTSNSAPYDTRSYSCYKKLLGTLEWNFDFCGWACSDSNCPVPYAPVPGAPRAPDPSAGSGFEEFRNCADIRVLASGGPAPTPVTVVPAPAPATAAPTPSPATAAPTPAPATAAPTPVPATAAPTPSPMPVPEPEPEPEPAPVPQGCGGPAPTPGPTMAPQPAPTPAPGTMTCVATPGQNGGATDAYCAQCAQGYQWWPCNQPNLCTCSGLQLAQVRQRSLRQARRHKTMGASLVQDGARLERAELQLPEDEDKPAEEEFDEGCTLDPYRADPEPLSAWPGG